METNELLKIILECGAASAAPIRASELVLSAAFRSLCEQNSCGSYGRCWACPPHIGPVEDWTARIRAYDEGVLYQSVAPLEDSFDFEGMMAAAREHAKLGKRIEKALKKDGSRHLHLGAGGCHICKKCTAPEGKPCRHPDKIMPPLEGCGVDVYKAAKTAGLNYINGPNTVTYFGLVLRKER